MLISRYGSDVLRSLAVLAILPFAWVGNARALPRWDGSPDLSVTYGQAVASPIRTEEDRRADAMRKPLEFLRFAQVRPGMRVLDVSAGAGYTTQLLALAVGSNGTVWAQTPTLGQALQQRLAGHPESNIIPVIRPFDDPVPGGASGLDLITLIMNYHDIAYMPVDRAKMDRRLFDALKPGGHLVILDHSAKPGAGISAAKSLHRIDQAVVVSELQRAGFRLEQESDAWRNPSDPREQAFFDMDIPTDKFALRFVKP